MIEGIGVDLVDSRRIEGLYKRFRERFLDRLFTPKEQAHYAASFLRGSFLGYAKLFAAKEAFVKALGTGFTQGISWHDIEVDHASSGQPFFQLTGRAQAILKEKAGHNCKVHLSLADEPPYCQAFVIIST